MLLSILAYALPSTTAPCHVACPPPLPADASWRHVYRYALRTYLYTLLTPTSVACFLPIELLHGVSFSLSRAASVDYVQAVRTQP